MFSTLDLRLMAVCAWLPVFLATSSCSVPEKAAFRTDPAVRGVKYSAHYESINPASFSFAGSSEMEPEIAFLLQEGIAAQREAGFADYDPQTAYVVDPSAQEMTVYHLESLSPMLTIPVGTGKNGLGFGGGQTPTGFFTMGGVRIARGANAYIQTGDSRQGVSGIYAEILYPPSHHNPALRGRVPNNVVIHGFNPRASQMLKERHTKKLIGKYPCTTGCPVPAMKDLSKLAPFLPESAGAFDPTSRPNGTLQSLLRKKQVIEYTNESGLGDPILILDRPFRR
jgi:hypothetical protein